MGAPIGNPGSATAISNINSATVEFKPNNKTIHISDDGPDVFSSAASKAQRITSHTADDLDTIQSKSKRQDQTLLNDISSRLVGQLHRIGGGER